MKTFNKQEEFVRLYSKILSGTSFTMFIGGVRVSNDNTSNEIIVNDGIKRVFTITDEKPPYEICAEIVELASNEKYFVDEELIKEVSDIIHMETQNSEESVFLIRGVPLHWIPNEKTVVLLSDDYFSVDFRDLLTTTQNEISLASSIRNVELKREDPQYLEKEKQVRQKEREFFDRITELESCPEIKDTIVGVGGTFIIERNDLGQGYEVMVLVDNMWSEFSIITFKGSEVIKTSKRYYNNPSTINSLAWDYVACTDMEALSPTN